MGYSRKDNSVVPEKNSCSLLSEGGEGATFVVPRALASRAPVIAGNLSPVPGTLVDSLPRRTIKAGSLGIGYCSCLARQQHLERRWASAAQSGPNSSIRTIFPVYVPYMPRDCINETSRKPLSLPHPLSTGKVT